MPRAWLGTLGIPFQQRLGMPANSPAPGSGPPGPTGEAPEIRVAILGPALMGEKAEPGFQQQEEVGTCMLRHARRYGQEWPLLCPADHPGDNSLYLKACRLAWGPGHDTTARPESGPSQTGLHAGSCGRLSLVLGPEALSASPLLSAGQGGLHRDMHGPRHTQDMCVPAGQNLHTRCQLGAEASLGAGMCSPRAALGSFSRC